MTQEPGGNTGVSSSEGDQTPVATAEPTPTPVQPTAKVEIKEGKVVVDGKQFVAESHLIAAKRGLEGQLKQQQIAHEAAIDKAKLDASATQQQIAQLNAKLQENEQARQTGAVTDVDAAKVKQELETAKSSMEQINKSALEYRRALLVLQYGVAADTIKEKNMAQLDSFEEAIKAVSTARGGGVGPYAIGGGTGEAAPQTPIERARKVLDSTPVRGVRNAPSQT